MPAGSEVELAIAAADALGHGARVVSMPSTSRFDQQDAVFRESVLPASCIKRLAIEAGHPDGWYKYVGLNGRVIGMQTFGESGPGGEVMKHLGSRLRMSLLKRRFCNWPGDLELMATAASVAVFFARLRSEAYLIVFSRFLINDPADAESLVHLTHYDSTHGRSERIFQNNLTGGYLLNGRPIALTQSMTPIHD